MLVTHKLLVAVFVEDSEVKAAVGAIAGGASTGQVGDGLIAVSDMETMYRITPQNGEPREAAESAEATEPAT
jgi:nitrogen regulatory protein PII